MLLAGIVTFLNTKKTYDNSDDGDDWEPKNYRKSHPPRSHIRF